MGSYSIVGSFCSDKTANGSVDSSLALYVYDVSDKTIGAISLSEYKSLKKAGVVFKHAVTNSKIIWNYPRYEEEILIGRICSNSDISNPEAGLKVFLDLVDSRRRVMFNSSDYVPVGTDFGFMNDDKSCTYVLSLVMNDLSTKQPMIIWRDDVPSSQRGCPKQQDYGYELLKGTYGLPIPSMFARYIVGISSSGDENKFLNIISDGLLRFLFGIGWADIDRDNSGLCVVFNQG